ncbi:MAG TPA: MBL fold metallo-hydrolase [Pyrinomonadaceae bacterium]|jgi:glyoxylase-like metal-dependent hydrolase (beta-lactamase superfamily II)
MKIHSISVPTPFYVGDTNVYLIAEDPLTIVDVGPKTKEAAAALREGLRKHGFRFSDIRRILLTHAHEDHCGLAKQVRDEAKNAEILVHNWETGHLFGRTGRAEDRNLMFRAGVPGEVSTELEQLYGRIAVLTDALEDNEYSELQDEMELEFESGCLRVLHTPGHTPGSCSFLREANRTILAGDCVLKRITPNPILSPDPINPEKRFQSLGEFLVSLARLRSFAPTLVLGGHGEPVHDFEEIFNRYVRAINERQTRILNLIGKQGATAWEIAQKLFPDAIDRDVHRFLAISESIAHLDYAETESKITVELKDGVEFYRKL